MTSNIASLRAEQQAIARRAEARGATRLNDIENEQFLRLSEEIEALERRGQLRSTADRIWQAAHANTGRTTRSYRATSSVYNEHSSHSFWADLVRMKSGDDADGESRRRLTEHAETETRLTTTGDGSTFSPPEYLLEQWIPAAVAGKPFVATLPEHPAPKAHTIDVPRIVTPPTVAVQNPELSTVSNTDLVDTYASTNLTTVAGQQLVSRQLLDQSPIAIDSVIFQSLSQVWAQKQDDLALHGTGSSGQFYGLDNISGIQSIGSPGNSIQDIYDSITTAISLIWSTRYAAPTHVLAHPNTITEWMNKLDTTNRPLFVPYAQGPMNAAAILNDLSGQGPVGTILGLQLVADPNVSTVGSGANATQPFYVYRADDLMWFDSGPRAQVHFDYAANELGVLLSLWSYSGLISRYAQSIVKVTNFPFGS
jgi:HK97 family phage major capsid protein